MNVGVTRWIALAMTGDEFRHISSDPILWYCGKLIGVWVSNSGGVAMIIGALIPECERAFVVGRIFFHEVS